MIKHACRIVEYIAIELTKRHDSLQWVSQRVLGHDHAGQDERQWAPENGSDGFHAQHEGILCLVPGVRE